MGALRPVVFPVPPTRRVLPAVCGTGVFVPGVSTTVVLRGLLVVALLSALPGGLMPTLALAEADADEPWKRVQSSDGSAAVARHEASAVTVGGKLYLIGGRGMRPVQVYDPATKRWRTTTPLPRELHHFQPVAIGTDIFFTGAFTCCYPAEETVPSIYRFDTITETWTIVGNMPVGRRRGSVGAAVRDGWIYLLGGNTRGHRDGSVTWFDRYNPATDVWEELPDAPHARDHYLVAIVGDTLVAAAGRTTRQPDPFANPVVATDRYDFVTGKWTVGKPIPTARAGVLTVVDGDEVIVAGGEINTSEQSLKTVQAYSVSKDSWRSLQPMHDGRHSGGGVIIGNEFHVAAGSKGKGGAPETSSHETLLLDSGKDTDADGLRDRDETDKYQTDPANPDTDADELLDGLEVTLGTNPLAGDTDGDTLSDGAEVNDFGTDPTLADTDADGLDDANEVGLTKTNPLLADTDADGLSDKIELDRGTNPLLRDSDSDGLSDLDELTAQQTDPNLFDTDGDGLGDGDELNHHMTSPIKADTDDDGLDDRTEIAKQQTDPLKPDTDGDTLLDGDEINRYLTSPLLVDTDMDTLTDDEEIRFGTNPDRADTDGDALSDSEEIRLGTNPRLADTDEDALPDGEEIRLGADPLLADTDGDGQLDGVDKDPLVARKKKSGGAASVLMLLLMSMLALTRRRSTPD